jgi:molybdopterin-guanine dinucleotide biosynthesis protein A
MTHPVAVVLAGGLGTRMKSGTPKLLHSLCGRPMLAYVLDAARAATGADPVVVYSRATAALREAFPAGVSFALQERPDGTGDALRAGLTAVPADADEVVVLSGDVPLIEAEVVTRVLERRRDAGATVALVSFDAWEPGRLGRVIRTADGERVTRIVEAKDATPDELVVSEVNAGFYALDAAWLRGAIGRLTPSPATGGLRVRGTSTAPESRASISSGCVTRASCHSPGAAWAFTRAFIVKTPSISESPISRPRTGNRARRYIGELWAHIGRQTTQHRNKDLPRRGQGGSGLLGGRLLGIARIAKLPRVLGERRRPAKQRFQALVDLAARFSQLDQVVRLAKRNAMP